MRRRGGAEGTREEVKGPEGGNGFEERAALSLVLTDLTDCIQASPTSGLSRFCLYDSATNYLGT